LVTLNKSGNLKDETGAVVWSFTDQMGITGDTSIPPFSDEGDSGSVVVNNDNEVVGLLWGGDKGGSGGYATPIQSVESELQISICTASQKGVINTVPGAAIHTIKAVSGGEAVHPLTPVTTGQKVEPFPIWGISRARVDALSRQGFDADRWLRHAVEVRVLILTNPRVAVAWRRGRGPEMFRFLLEQRREAWVPGSESNHWVGGLGPFLAMLNRYGSTALRSDVAEFLCLLGIIDSQSHEAGRR
jgi:hypothetical protein